MDETYYGGKEINKHKDKKTKNTQGRSTKKKTPILGAVQRNGKVIAKVVSNTNSNTIREFSIENIKLTAVVKTDEYRAYRSLETLGYNHDTVDHGRKEFVKGDAHTNTLEGFWSQLKRSINETYHYVSKKYLQTYVDEFCFRYNLRNSKPPIFLDLFPRVARTY